MPRCPWLPPGFFIFLHMIMLISIWSDDYIIIRLILCANRLQMHFLSRSLITSCPESPKPQAVELCSSWRCDPLCCLMKGVGKFCHLLLSCRREAAWPADSVWEVEALVRNRLLCEDIRWWEKHGGGGSCVASKATVPFSGGEGLPCLHLSFFMCPVHTSFCCLWWSGRCLCLFQVCICLKKEPTIFCFSLLCVLTTWLRVLVNSWKELITSWFAFPSGVF